MALQILNAGNEPYGAYIIIRVTPDPPPPGGFAGFVFPLFLNNPDPVATGPLLAYMLTPVADDAEALQRAIAIQIELLRVGIVPEPPDGGGPGTGTPMPTMKPVKTPPTAPVPGVLGFRIIFQSPPPGGSEDWLMRARYLHSSIAGKPRRIF